MPLKIPAPAHLLPPALQEKLKEYEEVLRNLLRDGGQGAVEEGMARGLLESVLLEITPYDRWVNAFLA